MRRSFNSWFANCRILICSVALAFLQNALAEQYPDRFVWVFGWNLGRDNDVAEISRLLDTAAQHGINGAVMSLGLDTLCKKRACQEFS